MDEIDFYQDDFSDLVAKDSRYNARAYTFLLDCIDFLGKKEVHMSAEEILDLFRDRALDQYGPMAYAVLTDWGVSRTEDIGEMMYNLVESQRIVSDPGDSIERFAGAYDFREEFLRPYEA